MGIAPTKPEERARGREPWVFLGGGDVIVLKRSTESFESPTSSAPASVKASSAVDGAAARDPDREWAMSPSFARSLCACQQAS